MPHLYSETSTKKKKMDEGFTLDLGYAHKQLSPPKKRPSAKKKSQQSTQLSDLPSLETSSTDPSDDEHIVERYLEEPKTVVVEVSDIEEECRCHEILKAVEGLSTFVRSPML